MYIHIVNTTSASENLSKKGAARPFPTVNVVQAIYRCNVPKSTAYTTGRSRLSPRIPQATDFGVTYLLPLPCLVPSLINISG